MSPDEKYLDALRKRIKELSKPVDDADFDGCHPDLYTNPEDHDARVVHACKEHLTFEFFMIARELMRIGAASELPGWSRLALDLFEEYGLMIDQLFDFRRVWTAGISDREDGEMSFKVWEERIPPEECPECHQPIDWK